MVYRGNPWGHGHDDAHEDEEDHEGEEDHEEEGGIVLDEQTRWDAFTYIHEPIAGIDVMRGFVTVTDYAYDELEPSGEVGVSFDNETTEARLEIVHNTVGRFDGAFGFQYVDSEFSAVGEEALHQQTSKNLCISDRRLARRESDAGNGRTSRFGGADASE